MLRLLLSTVLLLLHHPAFITAPTPGLPPSLGVTGLEIYLEMLFQLFMFHSFYEDIRTEDNRERERGS